MADARLSAADAQLSAADAQLSAEGAQLIAAYDIGSKGDRIPRVPYPLL